MKSQTKQKPVKKPTDFEPCGIIDSDFLINQEFRIELNEKDLKLILQCSLILAGDPYHYKQFLERKSMEKMIKLIFSEAGIKFIYSNPFPCRKNKYLINDLIESLVSIDSLRQKADENKIKLVHENIKDVPGNGFRFTLPYYFMLGNGLDLIKEDLRKPYHIEVRELIKKISAGFPKHIFKEALSNSIIKSSK